MVKSLEILLIFLTLIASLPIQGDDLPSIIYFGGVGSEKKVLDQCFPSFRNYEYPVSLADQNKLVEEIKKYPQKKYIIAGHSSGSQYAINIMKTEKLPNHYRMTLVNLDGFAPRGVPLSVRRVCWNAENHLNQVKSRNFASMSLENNCSEVHTHSTLHCKSLSKWCLHFSVVNPDTPENLDNLAQGYKNCSEDKLKWLQFERKAMVVQPATKSGAIPQRTPIK